MSSADLSVSHREGVMHMFQKLNENISKYRPIPFWSWNDRLDPEELRRQIRAMRDASMGGFFMHARGGLETEYMSEEWFDAIEASIDEAQKQHMYAWCYDENGWPSGFAGTKLLEDKKNWVHYLNFKRCSTFDPNALAVYSLKGTTLCRLAGSEEGVSEYLCVYDRTNSSAVDVLNPAVTDAFLQLTHEKYYQRVGDRFGTVMMGFFSDEPQYFRYATAYTPVLIQAYREKYGQELLDQLGALFVDCDGAFGFRFRYWHLMNILYTENFAGRVYRWCHDHHCMFTGHTIEERTLAFQMACCGGVMPFYEYEDIPGIDCLCRGIGDEMMPRQVSSVAQQLGKKQVLTETFAATGWDVTPRELKRIAEWQYVHGVNLMCHHLYPYSIRGQRKRDYPAFYSVHNPWTVFLKEFNDYFTTLGYLLAESTEQADVLIVHPMHSAYLTYNREEDADSVRELSASFAALIEQFGAAGIVHHYGDEVLMAKYGSIENRKLRIGQCCYDTVVIPSCQTLDSSTVRLLRQYLEQGGRLWLADDVPKLQDGEKADLGFLRSTTDFSQIAEEKALWKQRDTSVRATYRMLGEKAFVYAVNLSEDTAEEVELILPFGGAERLNLDTQTTAPLYYCHTDNGIRIPLTLEPGQSIVLIQNNAAQCGDVPRRNTEYLPIPYQMQLAAPVENALTIDVAAFSCDGKTYTDYLPVMAISDHLLRSRKNTPLWLKYRFFAEYAPTDLTLEVEATEDHTVMINGTPVLLAETGRLDRSFICGRIAEYISAGWNEIVLHLNYHQPEHVYDVFNGFFYGEGEITETMYNCLTYETNIEAIYLFGKFAVKCKSAYRKAEHGICMTSGPFSLTRQPERICGQSITESGFPFFSGPVQVRLAVNVPHTNWTLRCRGRYQYVRIWVNGAEAKKILLQETSDLSSYLKPGQNELVLEIMSSNRNLFGPHHVAGDPEPQWVGPIEFSRYGTWKDCRSDRYDPDYALVRFGLDLLQLEAN